MGLPASIYKSSMGDASNNGISSRCTDVLIVNGNGPFRLTPERAPVIIKVRQVFGNPHLSAHPVEVTDWDAQTWKELPPGMFGGCFIFTSDSRMSELCSELVGYRYYAAVALHDRYER